MYGRKVFQILQKKKAYPPRPSSTIEPMSIPVLRSISWPEAGGCQASPGSMPLMEKSMHWWRTAQCSLPCLYTTNGPALWKSNSSNSDQACGFHAVPIEGYDTNGFFFRNSWGQDWGNNGCGYLPFSGWNRVVEAWVGFFKRTEVMVESQGRRKSVYGNARRPSVAV